MRKPNTQTNTDALNEKAFRNNLRRHYSRLKDVLDDYMQNGELEEDDIYHAAYRLSQSIDWFCNKDHPAGGHRVPNKEEVIRNAIGKYYNCLNIKTRFSRKTCMRCTFPYATCYTNRGSDDTSPKQRRDKVIEEIRSGIKRESEVCFGRKPAKHAIPLEEFHERLDRFNEEFYRIIEDLEGEE